MPARGARRPCLLATRKHAHVTTCHCPHLPQAGYVSDVPESVISEQAPSSHGHYHHHHHHSRQLSNMSVPETVDSEGTALPSASLRTGPVGGSGRTSVAESLYSSYPRSGTAATASRRPSAAGTVATAFTGGRTPAYSTDFDQASKVEEEDERGRSYPQGHSGDGGRGGSSVPEEDQEEEEEEEGPDEGRSSYRSSLRSQARLPAQQQQQQGMRARQPDGVMGTPVQSRGGAASGAPAASPLQLRATRDGKGSREGVANVWLAWQHIMPS